MGYNWNRLRLNENIPNKAHPDILPQDHYYHFVRLARHCHEEHRQCRSKCYKNIPQLVYYRHVYRGAIFRIQQFEKFEIPVRNTSITQFYIMYIGNGYRVLLFYSSCNIMLSCSAGLRKNACISAFCGSGSCNCRIIKHTKFHNSSLPLPSLWSKNSPILLMAVDPANLMSLYKGIIIQHCY